MKIAGAMLIVFFLLMPAFAWADDAVYRYPVDDSYAATILGTPQNLRPDKRGTGTKPPTFAHDHKNDSIKE